MSDTIDVRLFIATNERRPYPEGDGYWTLQTGSALAAETFAMLADNAGDNISALNPSFCELTALYWIWRNVDASVVGLTHHRRFFAPRRHPGIPFLDYHVAAAHDFEELGRGIDIVVPTPVQWRLHDQPESLLHQYGRFHVSHDMFLVREEIGERSPEYLAAFDFVLATNVISHHNMFVARKPVIDEYCGWLFPILFAAQRTIPYEFYEGYQLRVFGYLAERLFNVWLCKRRRDFRILYRDIVRTEIGIL